MSDKRPDTPYYRGPPNPATSSAAASAASTSRGTTYSRQCVREPGTPATGWNMQGGNRAPCLSTLTLSSSAASDSSGGSYATARQTPSVTSPLNRRTPSASTLETRNSPSSGFDTRNSPSSARSSSTLAGPSTSVYRPPPPARTAPTTGSAAALYGPWPTTPSSNAFGASIMYPQVPVGTAMTSSQSTGPSQSAGRVKERHPNISSAASVPSSSRGKVEDARHPPARKTTRPGPAKPVKVSANREGAQSVMGDVRTVTPAPAPSSTSSAASRRQQSSEQVSDAGEIRDLVRRLPPDLQEVLGMHAQRSDRTGRN